MSEDVIAVRYIGKRKEYVENTYGSRIRFEQGVSYFVPAALALKLLKHADQYEAGEVLQAVRSIADPKKQEPDNQDTLDRIREFSDVAAIKHWIQTMFPGHKINGKAGLDTLKQQAARLVDQYGVPG